MVSATGVSSLTATCPGCGFRNSPDGSVCTFCRAPLTAPLAERPDRRADVHPAGRAADTARADEELHVRAPADLLRRDRGADRVATSRRDHVARRAAGPDRRQLLRHARGRQASEGVLPRAGRRDPDRALPVHLLPGAVRRSSSRGDREPEASHTPRFGSNARRTHIPEGGLAECLQGLEFNGKTGTLHVFGFGKGRTAWLAVKGGLPMAAEAEEHVDEEAVLSILCLARGRFVFSREMNVPERRIKKNMTDSSLRKRVAEPTKLAAVRSDARRLPSDHETLRKNIAMLRASVDARKGRGSSSRPCPRFQPGSS